MGPTNVTNRTRPPRRLPRLLLDALGLWLVLEGFVAAVIYSRPTPPEPFGYAGWFRAVSTIGTIFYVAVVACCSVVWGLAWLVVTARDLRRATRGLESDVRRDR